MRFRIVVLLFFIPVTGLKSQIIDDIRIVGNTKTKEQFIHRHVEFEAGETIGTNYKEKRLNSINNLTNTGLFNFVLIDTVSSISSRRITLQVTVSERWYLWPFPQIRVYETNFNTWLKSPDLKRMSYGLDLTKMNVGGKGKELRVLLRAGYIKAAGIEFRTPFLKYSKSGLALHVSYIQRNEIIYGTNRNVRLFYKTNNPVVYENYRGFASYYYRPSVNRFFRLSLEGDYHILDDSLAGLNEILPEHKKEQLQLITTLQYRLDARNFRPYPTEGHFLDVTLNNHSFDKNLFGCIFLDLRQYEKASSRLFFGGGLKGKIGIGPALPYLLSEGLGYREYVRGYEYYVVDSRHYALVKTNIKYKLLDKVRTIRFTQDPRLNHFPFTWYLTVFADAGFAWENQNNFPNSLQDKLLSGVGVGMDFVSYYDRVLRLEFSVNQLNETGIYVHFTQPI